MIGNEAAKHGAAVSRLLPSFDPELRSHRLCSLVGLANRRRCSLGGGCLARERRPDDVAMLVKLMPSASPSSPGLISLSCAEVLVFSISFSPSDELANGLMLAFFRQL
jgi:hypothetical protein